MSSKSDMNNDASLTELFVRSAERRNQNKYETTIKKTKKSTRKSQPATDEKFKQIDDNKMKGKRKANKPQTVSAEEQRWLFDPWLMLIALTILFIGIVMVGSASISIAEQHNGDPFYYLYRQLMAAGIGIGLGLVVLATPIAFWQKSGPVLLIVSILLLIAILIPGVGREINGSVRWISLGNVNLQISEIVKLTMVIYLAGYLVRQKENLLTSVKGFIMPMLLLGVISILLLLEPDLGAAVVISATVFGMLFIAGVRLWQFAVLLLLMVAVVYMLVIFEPYRLERLQSFMDPWADPYDTGFQLTQSLIAFGRGEISGVGLGNSIQKLFYLPEAHTDFLFAVLAEEMGLIGSVSVIFLFTALVSRIFVLSVRADAVGHLYSAYLMYGLGIWIGLQAFVNMAVNMGALPTKGLTLPLMSYGGSSMMIMCIVIALVLRAEHELRFKSAPGINGVFSVCHFIKNANHGT